MRTIRLKTPQHFEDNETTTEYDASKISGIKSVVGDDDREGTHFWIAGSFERQFCVESARHLRRMIEDALNGDDVRLGAEAVGLLVRGVQSEDGAIHFIESDGFLNVATSDFASEALRGRARSQHEHARDELVGQGFIVSMGSGSYRVTQRGYEMGDHMASGPLDKPFQGVVRLSARHVEPAPTMIFNQTNQNKGDVNNAISEKGDVTQNVTKITGSNPVPAKPRTILFFASNPKDTNPLRLDEEVREIDEGLRRATRRDQFKLAQKFAVRSDDLRRGLLDEVPAIVHFSGHGSATEGLVCENEVGEAETVPPDALADLFGLCAGHVECVVLNACYTEDQASAIAQHISFVVGMGKAIGDEAAIKFAIGFYDAIGAGRSYEDAFKFGRNAINLKGIPEHLTPQLKKKK